MSEEQIATVSKMCLKALAYLHSQLQLIKHLTGTGINFIGDEVADVRGTGTGTCSGPLGF